MASFKAKFPVLQELFAKNHRGALCPPPPSGARVKTTQFCWIQVSVHTRSQRKIIACSRDLVRHVICEGRPVTIIS